MSVHFDLRQRFLARVRYSQLPELTINPAAINRRARSIKLLEALWVPKDRGDAPDGAETDPCVQVVRIFQMRTLAGTADTLELPDEGLEAPDGR